MLIQRRLRLASRIANELESHLRNDDLPAARLELRALRKRMSEASQQLAALTERLDPGVRLPKAIATLQPPFLNPKRRRLDASEEPS